jgi:hypothetical protein
VSDFGRLLRGQWDRFAKRVLQLDGCLGGLGVRYDQAREGGGLRQGLLHVLELYGHRESVGRLTTLPVTIKSSISVSSDGDDTMQL